MKVLFAVSNESISNLITKKYQEMYKEIISGKNVYYFNAILKELQKDKSYDRIVISEDLEPFTSNNFDTIDNFIFDKLDSISDEASNNSGEDIPIILIATDRRTKTDNLLVKLFGIGVYSTLIGQDRNIDEVCKLISKPRTKKEAKAYYQIDSGEVEYKVENEGDVSEMEIQNILNHYKKLGKNEDKYADSFNSISAQYTDAQLKLIIKFLPLNVKAVLEETCPKYQQLMAYSSGSNKNSYNTKPRKEDNTGIKIESILENTGEKKLTKPVIIPSTVSTRNVKKVEESNIQKNNVDEEEKEETIDIEKSKRRGRPKKIVSEEIKEESDIQDSQEPKKRRGRPKKVQETPEKEEEVNLFDLDEEKEDVLPGIEDEDDILSNFDEEDEDVLPEIEKEEPIKNVNFKGIADSVNEVKQEKTIQNKENKNPERKSIYDELVSNPVNVFTPTTENLLTKDKKIVSFVGTSKNGTSFLVNNLAELLSSQGIRTAILDLTKNKNAYYIYTKNEEELRKVAFECMDKLTEGVAEGIKVNKSLDVYTCLPGEENYEGKSEIIIKTLVKNYSLVLIDCDFQTEYEYIKESQEVYLVQSMDILTIQPLTAYLRDLKAKGALDPQKLRAVINKSMKVRSVTERTILGGMAFYNDPAMSFMTELFNRETIKYTVMPFDVQAYSKYLEGLVNCSITLNGYSKEFMAALRKLAGMVYPLINSKNKPNNDYSGNFSNSMNDTLDKMKGIY